MPSETAVCRFCSRILPLTEEHWYRRSNGGFYIRSRCRSYCEPRYRAELRRDRAQAPRRASRAPATPGRSFGVELEFTRGPAPEDVVHELTSRGLAVRQEGYNHAIRSRWKLTTDASCGWELVSPPLAGEDGRRQIREACSGLRAAGAMVNSTCGFHVHFGASDTDVQTIIRAVRSYVRSQAAIDRLVSPARRQNGMCRHVDGDALNAIARAGRSAGGLRNYAADMSYDERFRSINVRPYASYGTIEFRQHQGTLNARKVLAWVDFGMALFTAAEEREVYGSTPEELIAALGPYGLGENTSEFLLRRAEAFRAQEQAADGASVRGVTTPEGAVRRVESIFTGRHSVSS